jgi:hypothetical protein
MEFLPDSPLALSNLASAIVPKEKGETAMVSPLCLGRPEAYAGRG